MILLSDPQVQGLAEEIISLLKSDVHTRDLPAGELISILGVAIFMLGYYKGFAEDGGLR